MPVYDELAGMFDVSSFTHDGVREAVVNGQTIAQIPGHDITEDALAEYFKVNFDTELLGMQMSGNVGVREVKTETSAAGVYTYRIRVLAPTMANPDNFTDVTVGNLRTQIDRDYSDTLPSANLHLKVKEDLSIRLGFAELMSRPLITDLAPAANCLIDTRPGFSGDTDADDCTAGNPALKPYRAKSYDLEFSYYPTDEVEMRLGGFYKDIDTFIIARTLTRDVDFFGDGTLFDVTMPINGAGAKTQGIEASVQAPFTFLPGWASGLAVWPTTPTAKQEREPVQPARRFAAALPWLVEGHLQPRAVLRQGTDQRARGLELTQRLVGKPGGSQRQPGVPRRRRLSRCQGHLAHQAGCVVRVARGQEPHRPGRNLVCRRAVPAVRAGMARPPLRHRCELEADQLRVPPA